jgi:hypothetical protein
MQLFIILVSRMIAKKMLCRWTFFRNFYLEIMEEILQGLDRNPEIFAQGLNPARSLFLTQKRLRGRH